eukprot:1733517-Amphidinium_carterae.2
MIQGRIAAGVVQDATAPFGRRHCTWFLSHVPDLCLPDLSSTLDIISKSFGHKLSRTLLGPSHNTQKDNLLQPEQLPLVQCQTRKPQQLQLPRKNN